MKRFFTTSAALGALLLCAVAGGAFSRGEDARAAPARPTPIASAVRGLAMDDLPRTGQCRLWYDALPREHQAAPMECEHADWLAKHWGGRVIGNAAEGGVELASYQGANDFTGVPATALPHAGYCRAWIDGVAAEAQPDEDDCRGARRTARERGGRVLFMPM
jgi:hypothetical protein